MAASIRMFADSREVRSGQSSIRASAIQLTLETRPIHGEVGAAPWMHGNET